jgi:hypothetical protein
MRKRNLRTLLGAVVLVALTAIASMGSIAVYAQTTCVTYIVALDGSGNFKDIQDAINAVPPGIKGIIMVKNGTYTLKSGPVFPHNSLTVKSNLEIRGAGMYKTVIRSFPNRQPAGSTTRAPTIISKAAIQNLTIADLSLTQNGTPDNMGWNTIDLRGGISTNVKISNVRIASATGAGISIPHPNNVVIENCLINTTWTGIMVGSGYKCEIRNCRIVNTWTGIVFKSVNNSIIDSNIISLTQGDGIYITGDVVTKASSNRITIANNRIYNVGDTGIDVSPGSSNISYAFIALENNIVDGYNSASRSSSPVGSGITIWPSISNFSVRGNILQNLKLGSYINGFNGIISGNLIFNFSAGSGIWAWSGNFVKSSVTVEFNRIYSASATLGISTNKAWVIQNNRLTVGGRSGNLAICASNAIKKDNLAYS